MAKRLLMSSSLLIALFAWAEPAAAEDEGVPILIEAGNADVRLDEMRCSHATCEGRIPPGRHTLTLESKKEGAWVVDSEKDIDIDGPTVIHVEGPSLLRRTAVVTMAVGGVIVAAGVLVPLFVCTQTNDRVDPLTGEVQRSHPCSDLSDGVKIGWIGGIGVGLTLAMLGAIGFATSSGATTVTARHWSVLPYLAPRAAGIGFVASF